jgi:hypothetical protein
VGGSCFFACIMSMDTVFIFWVTSAIFVACVVPLFEEERGFASVTVAFMVRHSQGNYCLFALNCRWYVLFCCTNILFERLVNKVY